MRTRLIALVAATTSLVALAFVVPLAVLVREIAEDRAVRPAELATRTLAPAVGLRDAAELAPLVDAAATGLEGPVGVVLASGGTVGAPPPPGLTEHVRREQRTQQLDVADGVAVVVPVAGPDGVGFVHASVPGSALHRGVATAWWILGGLALLLVVGAALLADTLARRTLAAIDRVERTAQRLIGGDLDARAEVEDPPEIARVAAVLGRLAERITELLEAEREAAADLSHRLRTPLTPLRVDVEALPPSSRRDQLLADVDALSAEVSRVIDAFRGRRDVGLSSCDASEVVRERASFWGPLAEDQGRSFEVDAAAPALVPIDRDDLADALDALLGNVFTHTPEGTPVTVAETVDDASVRIAVSDAGPGWPEGVAVWERGATGAAGSTGLGLDIVRRVARSAGGKLELGRSSRHGGAEAVLTLPLVADGGMVT